ncbi:MAG: maltooligosyltrehalose trehalohydrolase, partial [Alphaproteobacteria bacterium]|nr:maltooligosyltrehalose trehalohydrolase [Alphaproteobacteria bacterium]
MTAERRFGPLITPTGVMFRLWAPAAKRVAVVIDRPQEMIARPHGWFELEVAGAGAGTRYRFRIDDDIEVPDPASAFQPQDVHGPSEVVDHAYAWKSRNWSGRPWHECVLLELHVGAFTPEGSYRGAIDKLDHLVDAGFTAIELMPLSDFAGRWNWGYDGVLPFAPDSSYGRPDDLKALIDAAHQRGLMVFLDVVYNHFGPEGNYLGRYAPGFFTAANTPWGSAIDYRVPQVRAFAIENALAWLRDYRFDGLRLDAVHAIVEPGVPSVLADLSLAVGSFAQASGRQIHLVLENDDNQASLLDPLAASAPGKYRAQWNDD